MPENDLCFLRSRGYSFPGEAGKRLHTTGEILFPRLKEILASRGKYRVNILHTNRP